MIGDAVTTIEKENPVPLSKLGTLDKFQNALTKAKLFYEAVEVSQKFQVALAYNKNGTGQKDIATIYTSEKTNEVITKQVNYDLVNFSNSSLGSMNLPDGYFEVAVRNTNGSYTWNMGVIAHNGRLVAEPKYFDIHDVIGQGLICVEMDEEDPGTDDYEHYYTLRDYEGHLRLDLRGEINHRATLKMNNVDMAIIWNLYTNENWMQASRLFALYKGKLYKFWDTKLRHFGIEADINDKRGRYFRIGEEGVFVKEFKLKGITNPKNLVEQMKER